MCSISGQKDGVDNAIRRIHEIIQNVQERDGTLLLSEEMALENPTCF